MSTATRFPNARSCRFRPSWDPDTIFPVFGFIQLCWVVYRHLAWPSSVRVLELGSATGESATMILACPWVSEVTCVDTWVSQEAEELFDHRLNSQKSCGRLQTHKKTTSQFFEENKDGTKFDWIYVDASHDYEDVVQDLNNAWGNLREGTSSALTGHDYSKAWPGCKKAIDEFAEKNNLEVVTFPDSSWLLRER